MTDLTDLTDLTGSADLLARYDDRLREEAEIADASARAYLAPVWCATFAGRGFITYRRPPALAPDHWKRVVEAALAHFRPDSKVAHVEWKTRGHDDTPGLHEALLAHGFVADDVEAVMLGRAADLLDAPALPDDVEVRRAETCDDLARAALMQDEVFGGSAGRAGLDELAARVLGADDGNELWLAEADGDVVCAGRLQPVPGSGVAGIWGGATAPAWRGRGIYRALTAARARSALAHGYDHLHSDSTIHSRPILERSGFTQVTTTTPYVWTRP